MLCLFNIVLPLFSQEEKNEANKDFSDEMLDYDISKAMYLFHQNIPDFTSVSEEQQQEILSKASKIISDSLPIGLTHSALISLKQNIDYHIRNSDGEIAYRLTQLYHSLSLVLTEWDIRFSNQLDRTIAYFRPKERELIRDTETCIRMSQKTLRQIAINAMDSALVGVAEADIFAYDIAGKRSNNQVARLVYAEPIRFRVGLNNSIKIRGNFLHFKPYHFKIIGFDNEIIPTQYSNNEVLIQIPDEILNTIDKPTTLALTAKLVSRKKNSLGMGYRYYSMPASSILVTVLPKIGYAFSVRIHPEAKLPINHTYTFNFYAKYRKCDAFANVTRRYVLPENWELADVNQRVNLKNTHGPNCNSGLVGRGAFNLPPSSVFVEGVVGGCGYTLIVNCRGRGWWGYELKIPAKSTRTQYLQPLQEFRNVPNQTQRRFVFEYPLDRIPSNYQSLTYPYFITITVMEGTEFKQIRLSNLNPQEPGFSSSMVGNQLIVDIAQDVKIIEMH
jgi:hypothetical protein